MIAPDGPSPRALSSKVRFFGGRTCATACLSEASAATGHGAENVSGMRAACQPQATATWPSGWSRQPEPQSTNR